MPEVTHYSKPYPRTTDRAHGQRCCSARSNRFVCTRSPGHDGDHQAGGPGGQMYASWPAEEVAS